MGGARIRLATLGALSAAAIAIAAGCGGGGGDDDDDVMCRTTGAALCEMDAMPDAEPEPDPEPEPAACRLATNEGCKPGQKCAVLATADGHVAGCVAEGDRQIGEACRLDTRGIDDCEGGSVCTGGVCRQFCGDEESPCAAGTMCSPVSGPLEVFEIGVCRPSCDVFAQDCGAAEGCYLDLYTGATTCYPTGSEPGAQGEACIDPHACAPGYGCILANDLENPTGNVCARFCDPTGGGGPSCADAGIEGLTCVQVNRFYGEVDEVDDAIGMCVDCCAFAALEVCAGRCP